MKGNAIRPNDRMPSWTHMTTLWSCVFRNSINDVHVETSTAFVVKSSPVYRTEGSWNTVGRIHSGGPGRYWTGILSGLPMSRSISGICTSSAGIFSKIYSTRKSCRLSGAFGMWSSSKPYFPRVVITLFVSLRLFYIIHLVVLQSSSNGQSDTSIVLRTSSLKEDVVRTILVP